MIEPLRPDEVDGLEAVARAAVHQPDRDAAMREFELHFDPLTVARLIATLRAATSRRPPKRADGPPCRTCERPRRNDVHENMNASDYHRYVRP